MAQWKSSITDFLLYSCNFLSRLDLPLIYPIETYDLKSISKSTSSIKLFLGLWKKKWSYPAPNSMDFSPQFVIVLKMNGNYYFFFDLGSSEKKAEYYVQLGFILHRIQSGWKINLHNTLLVKARTKTHLGFKMNLQRNKVPYYMILLIYQYLK